MAVTRHRSKHGRLEDRLPDRFLAPVIDTGDVFGSLNAYADELDRWVRSELGLAPRHDTYHDKVHGIMAEIGIDPAEWIRVGTIGH